MLAAIHWLAAVGTSTLGNWSAEGLMAIGLTALAKEYRDERNKREALTERMITEIVPLLTRSTEAIERISFLYREAVEQSVHPRRK